MGWWRWDRKIAGSVIGVSAVTPTISVDSGSTILPIRKLGKVIAMRSTRLACLLVGVVIVPASLRTQNVNPMHPEEIQVQKHPSPEDMRARLANVQLQKDAKELAELCASVPGDIDGIKQGLLSQDLPEKLKRVEKLSKRLREQLTRASMP